jgi:hypothetical protein
MHDKQLVAGAAQWLQNAPDLLNTASLPQIHIHDEHAMRPDLNVAASDHAGDQLMPRVKHGADSGQLRRFIRYEVDEHLKIPSLNLSGGPGK